LDEATGETKAKTPDNEVDQKQPSKEKKGEYQKTKTLIEILNHAYIEEKKRAEELQSQLKKIQADSEEYQKRLRYIQADCENIRKRAEKDKEEIKKYANESLICKLLEIVDELEMAIENGRKSNNSDTIIQGVEMTLKKLMKVLGSEGVTHIECVMKPFDPSKHAAVANEISNDCAEGAVLEEVRKGYVMNEKVIRPSMVKIAVKPSSQNKED